jgi:hypothetical protein
MDSNDVKGTVIGGDTIKDAVDSLNRVVRRTARIATVAKRRYERNKTPENLSRHLETAQEYYYVSKLASDFRKAAVQAAAEIRAKTSSKN